MANQLKMAKIQAIRALHEQRWSQRQIAGELDVDRETVAKYVRAGACIPKPAKAPIGSDGEGGRAREGSQGPALGRNSWGEGCSRSAWEPYRQVILQKLELGLSAQRIYQDLVGEGFDHEYHSVRRFVAKLRKTSPLPFRRMECEAGEEAQGGFGTGAGIDLPGRQRGGARVFG